MSVVLPKPIRESKETVTLSRSDWEGLIAVLEDIEDMAAVAARKSWEAAVGVDAARRDYLSGDELRRLLEMQATPLKIWREKRGLSQRALAHKAGISPSYVAEMETGQKTGSVDALLALARALNVGSLIQNRLQIAYAHLKQFVEAGVSEEEAIKEGQDVIAALTAHGVHEADLTNLKEDLRPLAFGYGEAGMTGEATVLRAVIKHCFP
jgi:transcriptional regulator with XRE-family HTH domain